MVADMTRPLRLEFPGALYHVTARGDRSEPIFHDDTDRVIWLESVALVCARFNFLVHGFCQMTNHYHLLIETLDGNLAQGMRHLNGTYSQHFNRRHQLVGHLFQGRYHAILVQKESYLLEVSRYVVLNPIRAGMVTSLDQWPWSSYRFTIGRATAPAWLHTDWLLRQFCATRPEAISAYHEFVVAGIGMASPLNRTAHRLLLGDDIFVSRHRQSAPGMGMEECARTQRRATVWSLEQYKEGHADRDEAMARAYLSTAYTMQQIAAHFGVSYRTVGRAVRAFETRVTAKG